MEDGRPKETTADENVELVHSLIMWNRTGSLPDIARITGISVSTVPSISIS